MDRDIEQAGDKAAAADPVPAEAVEGLEQIAVVIESVFDGSKRPAHYLAATRRAANIIRAAGPLIVADRDATIERLKGAIKALDNGLAQHGEHIERLTAERDAALALPERIINTLAIVDGYPGQTERKAMPWSSVCAVRAALVGGGTSGGED